MPTASTDRGIRVFISSTFTDMKADRDYLVKFIFPQLRKLCEERVVPIVRGIAELLGEKRQVVLVTSGAVGLGRWVLGLHSARLNWMRDNTSRCATLLPATRRMREGSYREGV